MRRGEKGLQSEKQNQGDHEVADRKLLLPFLPDSISQSLDWKILRSSESALGLAEGARFELAVHEVDAGFQDRWFQPLTHPSDNDFS